jgi:hypothetical protein
MRESKLICWRLYAGDVDARRQAYSKVLEQELNRAGLRTLVLGIRKLLFRRRLCRHYSNKPSELVDINCKYMGPP